MSAPFRTVLRLELDLEAFTDEGRVDWNDIHESVSDVLYKASGLYSFQAAFNVHHNEQAVGKLTIDTERA